MHLGRFSENLRSADGSVNDFLYVISANYNEARKRKWEIITRPD